MSAVTTVEISSVWIFWLIDRSLTKWIYQSKSSYFNSAFTSVMVLIKFLAGCHLACHSFHFLRLCNDIFISFSFPVPSRCLSHLWWSDFCGFTCLCASSLVVVTFWNLFFTLRRLVYGFVKLLHRCHNLGVRASVFIKSHDKLLVL